MSGPPLPPTDRIVLALWRSGDARAAIDMATFALARNDRRRPLIREQLDRMREGRGPEVAGPDEPVALDEALAQSLVEHYRYHEASVIVRALGASASGPVRRLAMVLDEALSPFPAEADRSFDAALHLVKAGQAPSALRALEEVVATSPSSPPWLLQKQRALAALVRGHWKSGPAPVEEVTRDTVLARIRARDLEGALEASRAAHAKELSAVLERLLAMTERVFTESSDQEDPQTVPIEGHRLCEFQIRMGVLDEADRGYRAILRHHPDDDRARGQLADVIALRQALGESPEPLPPREVASVGWLSKNAPRGGGAWAPGTSAKHPRWSEEPTEDSTDVLEAAQEAELLLKLGKSDQALDMYRILAIRHPRQQVYRKRIAEIEALIAQRLTPLAAEVTLKHDLSELQKRAGPGVRLIMPDSSEIYPPFDDGEDEDGPTLVELPPSPDED